MLTHNTFALVVLLEIKFNSVLYFGDCHSKIVIEVIIYRESHYAELMNSKIEMQHLPKMSFCTFLMIRY